MKKEHGTIRNYVIGFVLSLVFTLIPYFMVVNHTVRGTTLLVTIIGFAVVQMIIQVFFFLHLGRERKPYWQGKFLLSTVGAICVVVGATVFIMYHLDTNLTPTQEEMQAVEGEGIAQIGGVQTGACEGSHVIHTITIQNGVASPSHTAAQKCDIIVFTNEDSKTRDIAFGPHEQHEPYGGVDELTLTKGQSQSLVLDQSGTYPFHDHLNDEAPGDFTVSP